MKNRFSALAGLMLSILLVSMPLFAATEVVSVANGPTSITRGAAYTPDLPGTVTNVATNTAFYWLEGNILHISGQITFNGVGGPSAALTVGLPSGFTAKTAQLPGGANTGNATSSLVGPLGFWFDNGNGWLFIAPAYNSTTTVKFFMSTQTLFMNQLANGDGLNYKIEIPVTNR